MVMSSSDPLRQCISCRVIAPRSQFWRVVRLSSEAHKPAQPAGKPLIQLDQGQGRSAYLCPQISCLADAQKRKRLERSLRTQVPAHVYDALASRLTPVKSPLPR
jgi:predicted RNA-binding protein YlxR (DUF448 family)